MDFYKLIYDSGFTESTKENFPASNCTIYNEKEPNVFDSKTPFMCLTVDVRMANYVSVKILYPYIFDDEYGILFSWVDKDGNIYGNLENTVHCFDKFVIAFNLYQDSTKENDDMWHSLFQKLKSQAED